jgi:hypothetical protein
MFRRRVPLGLLDRLLGAFWPRPGWRRAIAYRAHRIGRMPDSPHRLAAGVACGVAVSLTPLVGIQFVLAALLAVLVRGNVLASAAGSFIANPWTLPAIWDVTYLLGRWMLPGSPGEANPNTLDYLETFGAVAAAVLTLNFDLLPGRLRPIWVPMMVGSLPLAAVSWVVSYWLCRGLIARYQARRRERLQRRPRRQRGAGAVGATARSTLRRWSVHDGRAADHRAGAGDRRGVPMRAGSRNEPRGESG